jgi:rod shape-determining protein MreC
MRKFFLHNWRTAAILLVVVGVMFLALAGYLNPIIQNVSEPIIGAQGWFSSRYMAIVEFFTVPRDVASLRQRNAVLENEVSQYQTQIIQLEQQLREADILYALLDFARERPENTYVAAAIIGRDPSPFLHYVIIDHGSDDGLRHGMPVVTQQGLVGRVDAVTASAARVQLLSDPGAAVNVEVESTQTDALLTGSVTGDIGLQMIPQDVDLKMGDLVLTSGLGGGYPGDIVIGQIINIRKRETDLFQTASVQPAVDFVNLQAVLVITNFKPVDIKPLMQTPAP